MLPYTENQTAWYKTQCSALLQYQEHLPALISGLSVNSNNNILRINPASLRSVALYLRNSSNVQAASLVDIVVVDRIGTAGRFTVKYLFLSLALQARLTLSFSVSDVAVIPSLAAPFAGYQRIFAAAGWLEREVWDLFGLYFAEHGDLRRLLTDYGFTGHPLRKDFPLTGFHELSYSDLEGRVVIEPVELSQELRVFRFYEI